MELSEAEIKQLIADGKIRGITLDTTAFDGNGNRFERGLLAKLNQFNDTEVDFVLSDVVLGEVRRHVIRDAHDAKSQVVAALKVVGKAWQASNEQRDAAIAALFGKEAPEDLASRRINDFAAATQLEVVDSTGRVDVGRMLHAYFSSKPPFGVAGSKKNEFPDAIALQALESWAADKDVLVLVVSKDGDWKRYCKDSHRLVVVEDLALALSYFHQNAEVACARLVQRWSEGVLTLDADLQRAVESALDRINFIPEVSSGYFFDAEVSDVAVTAIALKPDVYSTGPFRVVDKPDEDVLVVEAEVEVTVDITASMTFSIVDSIDKDEVTIGGASPTVGETFTFKVLLTFEGDLAADAELVDSEIEASKTNYYVDFGDVGPDWDPEDV
jgi:hypothetical protein